jgi:hypothetical protein
LVLLVLVLMVLLAVLLALVLPVLLVLPMLSVFSTREFVHAVVVDTPLHTFHMPFSCRHYQVVAERFSGIPESV